MIIKGNVKESSGAVERAEGVRLEGRGASQGWASALAGEGVAAAYWTVESSGLSQDRPLPQSR